VTGVATVLLVLPKLLASSPTEFEMFERWDDLVDLTGETDRVSHGRCE
jgi:hypothetical protein